MPLTVAISRNMNLEFMCCILFGLSEIFMKPERKKLSEDSQIDKKQNLDWSHTIANNQSAFFGKDFNGKELSPY